MIPVRMMQVPIDQVINVIAVRYGRMPAVRTMNVVCVMPLAVVGDATVGVRVRDRNDMLVVMVLMGAVEMPVMQVSHMVAVINGYVTTVGAVLMVVVLVDGVGHVSILPVLAMNRRVRVSVVQDIPDQRLHMGIRQPIEHVSPVTPTRDEVLLQEDPQTL